ncbi:MAG: hypothetical protein VKK59_03535 [Vampirovibrionales bacterium]|nr:hypothetical protein [Vampirovibrionales bacterium]
MFKQLLQAAFESGQDVVVVIRGHDDHVQGRVQDVDGEYFTILSTGCLALECPGDCQGMLWAFHLADVQSVGLPLSKPSNELFSASDFLQAPLPESCQFPEDCSSFSEDDSSCHQKGNAID